MIAYKYFFNTFVSIKYFSLTKWRNLKSNNKI